MIAADALTGGFDDPVFQSQSVFRKVLDAFARPGTIVEIPPVVTAPRPLFAATAAFICTFADEGTPIHVDRSVVDAEAALDWIRFHTDAPIAADPREAAFAILADPNNVPPFSDFHLGTAEYPDRSTTILIQMSDFSGKDSLMLEGPGIDGAASFNPHPLPADFVERMRANRTLYPRGVDVVLASPHALAALPRSLRINASEGA